MAPLLLVGSIAFGSPAFADISPSVGFGAAISNAGVRASGSSFSWYGSVNGPGRQGPVTPAHNYVQVHEYRTTLGCGNQVNPDANLDPTACSLALSFCSTASSPDLVYYYSWYRVAGSNGPWQFMHAGCAGGDSSTPGVPAPPPIPSMAQIRQAFADLPFAKPSVNVQPVGGTTLVNLPTFYEIRWDGTGLRPGEISNPVQLLSWSVEFEVGVHEYDVDFGDGHRSGPTTDTGGPYPSGSIQHTYTRPQAVAEVTAQTRLTGRFRVNGGAWTALGSTADLQDEPVTTLRVAEAHAQLVSH